MKSINPTTGEPIRSYSPLRADELEVAIRDAHAAQGSWRRENVAHRAEPMRNAATVLRDRAGDYAELMALEMGKPLAQGRSEVLKCAWVCDYYAEHAEEFLRPEPVVTDAKRSFVAFEPLGLILAIMPWNFPFWQVFRAAVPALMAGNGVLLKHASNVTGCSLEIDGVFAEAGFPPGLFCALRIDSDTASSLLRDSRIRGVTLTGSTRAGRAIASAAGEALVKSVLELGGSDPYLILEDADIAAAAESCARSRLQNSGQSCIAAKRFIVVEAVRRTFEQSLVAEMSRANVGDPFDEGTDIGPMARVDLRDELHDQVERSVRAGARLLLGGRAPAGPGAFYPPTVLTNVGPGMAAYEEELFGPVAAILPARDEAEAIRTANDSSYGLGAAVFTRDVERGTAIAATELDAGCCFVNDFVKSDPRLPFGGIKDSGVGRELSRYGIREFVNIKTVYVA